MAWCPHCNLDRPIRRRKFVGVCQFCGGNLAYGSHNLFSKRGGRTMKKHKRFDCVQMKWDIQEKITKESIGIPAKEFNKIQMEKIAKNPILGQFLNKVYASTKRKEVQKPIPLKV